MSGKYDPALMAKWPSYRAVVEALEAAGHDVTLKPAGEERYPPAISITFADGWGLAAWEYIDDREDDDEDDEEQREWHRSHVWMVGDLDEDGDVDDTYDDMADEADVVGWANQLNKEHRLAHALGIDWRLGHRDPEFVDRALRS